MGLNGCNARRTKVAVFAAVGLGSMWGAPTASAAPFAPCPDQAGVECMAVPVPLDRSGAVPGTVNLDVRRVPARQGPSRGTIFFVAGGPGQSAVGALPDIASLFSRTLPNYDILTYDQRGTGRSGALKCSALENPGERSETDASADCAKELGPKRGFYRTADSVDDLEAVRQAAGGPQLSIYAVSYGAKVAGEYARRFPVGVSRLLLDSPTPLNGTDPLDIRRLRAMPPVFSALCARGACPFTRSAYGDLSSLAKRLRRGALKGTVVDSRGRGRRASALIGDLYGATVTSDTAAGLRAQLPSAFRSALRGDADPLLRALVSAGGPQAFTAQKEVEDISFVTNRATLCAESPFPWSPASAPNRDRIARLNRAIDQAGATAFAPFGPIVPILLGTATPGCLRWPAVTPPAPVGGPGPAVPTLVLSGLEDLRTPLASSREVAAGYPGGQVLTIPFTGHSVVGTDLSLCAPRAAISFLGGGSAPAACPASGRDIPVAPVAPRSLRSLRPLRFRGVRGRTVRATVRTASDVLAQLIDVGGPVRLGGLRGGRLAFDGRRRIVLADYEYVPGVRVSGVLRFNERVGALIGTLRVSGGGAVPAIVRITGSGVRVRFLRARRRPAFTGTFVRIEPLRLVRVPRVQVVDP